MTPCPFCGSQLSRTSNGHAHPTIKQGSPPCPLAGSHLGGKYIDWVGWPRGMGYLVVDGVPVFNDNGEGEPVTAAFLNACFDYIRNQGNE